MLMKIRKDHNWVKGKVQGVNTTPRSYVVCDRNESTFRRNSFFLRKSNNSMDDDLNCDTDSDESVEVENQQNFEHDRYRVTLDTPVGSLY